MENIECKQVKIVIPEIKFLHNGVTKEHKEHDEANLDVSFRISLGLESKKIVKKASAKIDVKIVSEEEPPQVSLEMKVLSFYSFEGTGKSDQDQLVEILKKTVEKETLPIIKEKIKDLTTLTNTSILDIPLE